MSSRIVNLAPPGSLLKSAVKPQRQQDLGRKPRERDEAHLARVRALPCLACDAPPQSEAAHVQMTSAAMGKRPGGIGAKRDDRWTLPLCDRCHRKQHREGEAQFWSKVGINPILAAHALWIASPDQVAMQKAWRKILDGKQS